MSEIVIRDVPPELVHAIDAKAKRLGLSRATYLRRVLERERVSTSEPVTVIHLARLGRLATDLDDPGVMSNAWS